MGVVSDLFGEGLEVNEAEGVSGEHALGAGDAVEERGDSWSVVWPRGEALGTLGACEGLVQQLHLLLQLTLAQSQLKHTITLTHIPTNLI